MLVYKVYTFDMTNGYELIGILPERRKNPMRVTRDSVINWGRMLLDYDDDSTSIIFKPVRIDDSTARRVWVNLPLHKHLEMA